MELPEMIWTDAMKNRLRELAGSTDAPSYKTIADQLSKEFKVKLTKNSCIGMARRIGVRKKPVASYFATHPAAATTFVPQFVSVELPDLAPPGPRNGLKTIMELDSKTCKWPFGDRAPYLFCGKPVKSQTYCKEHCTISYGKSRYAS